MFFSEGEVVLVKKPVLKPFASLEIKVDPPIVIGETSLGLRRFIPIRSGTITGEVKGRILPGVPIHK
ncbi:hypothetical protein ABE36_02025 [Bacillus subtilis]|nr:DUF3237 family protein [Bacillus subtilis]MBG9560013.1 hypothetical protein [Bacillus subtilis]BAO93582.1 hypothetical protein BSNT_10027 [Bacillus subtilis subsp. natto BEST195]